MKLAKLAAAAVLVVGGAAQAALLEGRTLAYLYFFPDLETPYEFAPNGHYVVGPGVEIVEHVGRAGTETLGRAVDALREDREARPLVREVEAHADHARR